MPVMLERWNDDKMDELSTKVDGLVVEVGVLDTKVDVLAIELREQRREIGEQRQEMKAGFERMYWLMVWAAGAIIVALIGAPHL